MYDQTQSRSKGLSMLSCWSSLNLACYSPQRHIITLQSLKQPLNQLCESILQAQSEFVRKQPLDHADSFLSLSRIVVRDADRDGTTDAHKLLYLTLKYFSLRMRHNDRSCLYEWLKEVVALFPSVEDPNEDMVIRHLRKVDLLGVITHLNQTKQQKSKESLIQLCIEHMQAKTPSPNVFSSSVPQRILQGDLQCIKRLSLGNWALYLTLCNAYHPTPLDIDRLKYTALEYMKGCHLSPTPTDTFLIQLSSCSEYYPVYQQSLSLMPPVLSHLIAYKQIPLSTTAMAVDRDYKAELLRSILSHASHISQRAALSVVTIYTAQYPFYCGEVQSILMHYVQYTCIRSKDTLHHYMLLLDCIKRKGLDLYGRHFAEQIIKYNCRKEVMSVEFVQFYCYAVDIFKSIKVPELPLLVKNSFYSQDIDIEALGDTLQIMAEEYPHQSSELSKIFQCFLMQYKSENEPTLSNRISVLKENLRRDQVSVRTLREIQCLLTIWEQNRAKEPFITSIVKYLQRNRTKFTRKHFGFLQRIGQLLG